MIDRCVSARRGAAVAVLAFTFLATAGAARGADFEVTAPGAWAGDTCGAGNDCALRSSADHEYLVHIPTAGDWTFSLCRAGWDTWMAVGVDPCSVGGAGWSNDDAPGCDGASVVTISGLAAGDYYVTIEGFSQSACGTYTLAVYNDAPCAAPLCPPDAMVSQAPTTPDGPWETWTSTYLPAGGLFHFESYEATGDIQTVRWWGLLIGIGPAACFEDPMDFVVRFYHDDLTGHPHYTDPHSVYATAVSPVLIPCDYDGFVLVQFEMEFDPPCSLQSGWISIEGDAPACYFNWMSSEMGDGVSLKVTEIFGQPNWETHAHDRSFCLVGAGCEGDVNADGEVNVLDLLAVLGAWGPCGGSCPQDVNGDGVVNVLDLLAVLGAWGPCG